MSLQRLKDHASVDSSTGTLAPLGPSSVQSSLSYDSLAISMERFTQNRRQPSSRSLRQIIALIRKHCEVHMKRLDDRWMPEGSHALKKVKQSQNLSLSCDLVKRATPPANLLRPPRGNLVCSTRDLYKEFVEIRRISRRQRSSAAARLIRTLDPALPTHNDIALSLFLIATL